jgi:ArsR family metal-binding transcriptional regulator
MRIKEIRATRPACDVSSEVVAVKVFLDRDLSDLMPYINAALDRARYFPKGSYIKFAFQGHLAILDRDCLGLAGFADDASARECAQEAVKLLQDLEARKDSITPDPTPYDPPTVMDVFKLLPKTPGCGRCGYPTCMAFAAAIVREDAQPGACPQLGSADCAEQMARLNALAGD